MGLFGKHKTRQQQLDAQMRAATGTRRKKKVVKKKAVKKVTRR